MAQLGLFDAKPEVDDTDPWGSVPPPPGSGDPDGLRYYQREAVKSIFKELKDNRSTLAVMATGLGKTQVFSVVAQDFPGNVLVLAHRDELVGQARDRLEQITGEYVEIEQADFRASHKARIVVGSVQTVTQKGRLERFGANRFDLIIVDEAHHYLASSFRRPLEFFSAAKILGVTATPDRGDERALGSLFDSVAYVMDIVEGINAGYLVPLKARQVMVDGLNLDDIQKTAGDLSASQLDAKLVGHVQAVIEHTLKLEPSRQGVAFWPGVRCAELATERFNLLRPGSAAFISGKTPKDERRRIVNDFKAGRFQYLNNCMVATEGFDAPSTSLIIQARFTLSRALHAQTVGRGTRVLPGTVEQYEGESNAYLRKAAIAQSKKPDCMVLDFMGNTSRHSLITTEDLLGGNYTEAEVKEAKKIAKKKPGGDVQEYLQQAREALRKVATTMKGETKARIRTVDPFAVLGVQFTEEERYDRFSTPASEAQKAGLRNLGVDPEMLNGLSRRGARKLFDEIRDRRDQGLATYKQMRALSKCGFNEPNLTFTRAKQCLDYLATHAWGRGRGFDPQELHRLAYAGRQPGED